MLGAPTWVVVFAAVAAVVVVGSMIASAASPPKKTAATAAPTEQAGSPSPPKDNALVSNIAAHFYIDEQNWQRYIADGDTHVTSAHESMLKDCDDARLLVPGAPQGKDAQYLRSVCQIAGDPIP